MDDSIAYREANAPHLANIDFVTEFPKPRNMKKGQPLGKRATAAAVRVLYAYAAVVGCLFVMNAPCVVVISVCSGERNVGCWFSTPYSFE